MDKLYTRVNWHNLPDTTTPINETNLNNMDNTIDLIDSRVVAIGNQIDSMATDVQVSLTVNGWNNNVQTVTVDGMTATAKGVVSLATNATATEREACRDALLAVTGQGTNSITITADGDVPTIALPINVLIIK